MLEPQFFGELPKRSLAKLHHDVQDPIFLPAGLVSDDVVEVLLVGTGSDLRVDLQLLLAISVACENLDGVVDLS